jgi:hypothetical protein
LAVVVAEAAWEPTTSAQVAVVAEVINTTQLIPYLPGLILLLLELVGPPHQPETITVTTVIILFSTP